MSTLAFTVSGVSYPIYHGNGTQQQNMFQLVSTYEMRDILTITVIDSPGTAVFVRGQPVVLSDSVLGTLYTGYVHADRPEKQSPDPTITTLLHTITCMDLQYLVDKRSNSQNYANWYAGDIVSNMAGSILAPEGVGITAAMRYDNTAAMFNQGNNSATVGSTSIPTNAGNLVLAPAGSNVTITEATTADFSSGTLTNVVAANNSLTPTTVSALKCAATSPGGGTGAFLSAKFWTGTMTVGTLDTLNYDIWIASSSPQITVAIDLTFSDGTTLSTTTGPVDQNNLSAKPATDLSNYAKDQWYTRNIGLTSALNGKTITNVLVYIAGTSPGTYTTYIKNVYLTSQSGSPFLSTSATTTNVSPPVVYQYSNYLASTVLVPLVAVFNPAGSTRISPSHSIDSVKLVKSSYITWAAVTPSSSSATIKVSYDGGTTYQTCTNNAALPMIPAGSNVASLSIILQESFTIGTDPTVLPSLYSVSITLQSAPAATKSDITTTYATQAQFNTGTYSNTQATSGGLLELAPASRNWNDNLVTNQTSFFSSGTSQTASGGVYKITCNDASGVASGTSRLDFAGNVIDLTIDCDVKIDDVTYAGITYRQLYWSTTDLTYGYHVAIYHDTPSGGLFILYRGTNGVPGATFATLASVSKTVTPGTFYHVKIVVSGSHHQAYFNNESTPSIDVTDSTFLQSGGIGLRALNNAGSGTSSGYFDNFVLAQTGATATWTSPAVSLSSLGTCGPSAIAWAEQNTSNPANAYAVVQTSVDGGSTFQTCTNGGGIPNLPSGTNVSSKTVQVLVTMGAVSTVTPIVSQLAWKVLGAYPGASGTRTTLPLGYDTFTRANGSVWGTADDTQTWVKSGTGTVAISSNTATISNTTGDVDELLGSRTATDQEDTFLVKISNSATSAGTKLRYTSSTKYYKLALSTTGLSIIKNTGSGESTLATTAGTYLVNTWYYLRFRVVGSGPINLYGKVWLGDGSTIEPGIVNGVISPLTPMWTVQATD